MGTNSSPEIILNQIRTPDGTVIQSMHRHDCVWHLDKNGLVYMVDGGTAYLRRNVHRTNYNWVQRVLHKIAKWFGIQIKDPLQYEELSIYSDMPFNIVRENFHRGGRGKDGSQPLTWVPMSKMSDSWLENCISYNLEHGMGDSFASDMYKKELEYRIQNKISIKE